MKRKILILNGPGLAGTDTAHEHIEEECAELCSSLGIEMTFRHAVDPDEIYRRMESDAQSFDGVIFNPAGGSQAGAKASHARQSALKALATLKKPVIEVYLDNIFREKAGNTRPDHEATGHGGLVCGLGIDGYLLGIRSLAHDFQPGASS